MFYKSAKGNMFPMYIAKGVLLLLKCSFLTHLLLEYYLEKASAFENAADMFVISHWFGELPYPCPPFPCPFVEDYLFIYFSCLNVKRINLHSSSPSAIAVLFITRKEIVSANDYHKYVAYLQTPSQIN